MLKESRYVKPADTMFRVIKKARIPLFYIRRVITYHSMAAHSPTCIKTI